MYERVTDKHNQEVSKILAGGTSNGGGGHQTMSQSTGVQYNNYTVNMYPSVQSNYMPPFAPAYLPPCTYLPSYLPVTPSLSSYFESQEPFN